MERHLIDPARRRALTGTIAFAAALATGETRAQSSTEVKGATSGASPTKAKRVVFVISNEVPNVQAGFSVGYWLAELAHPYWAFQQRGYQVTLASPSGGPVVHDAMSDPEGGRFGGASDFLSVGFKRSQRIAPLLAATQPLSEVRVDDFDAIFVVGGLGPMITFAENEALHRLFAQFFEAGKVSATLCHGSVILLKTRLSSGRLLAEGRQWTGFCNNEEDAVDKAYGKIVQPFRIEVEAGRIPNTRFVQGPAYRPFAVRDGLLISGQQGSSGQRTAELVIQALEA